MSKGSKPHMDVDGEIAILVAGLKRLAKAPNAPNAEGQYVVKFKDVFNDNEMMGKLEALVGTMKAAKKRKIIDYKGEILLQGVSNDVDVILLKQAE